MGISLMSASGMNDLVLLWQHTNPSQGLAPQTLAIDGLDSYRFVVIYTSYYAGGGLLTANLLDKTMSVVFCNGPCTGLRSVSFNGDRLTFGAGQYYAAYGNGTVTENNSFCVPTKIYGIK